MKWFEIKNRRIHRRWGARDAASIYKQLDLPLTGRLFSRVENADQKY